ncbi:MAG: lptD, partial [Acidobacteria bacterium]|nr:lptD [Acidobacteriota bacterium]
MPRLLTASLGLALVLGAALPALAQIPGFSMSKQFRLERLAEGHWRATGQVEMQRDDQQFFADVVDYYTDTGRLIATGNVVFVSVDSRIAADRVEFNTADRTGTFYNASGIASLGDRVDRSMFGTQEPDAYFYGETIEKLGPSKYRITKGGFTTCVQPTPRWELVASSATITIEEYAMLKHTVLRVKGVPVLYLPIIYYPIQEDDRSTGFLLPSYGNSSIRGFTLSTAFFWAIDASQDLTVLYDWFSRTGQGLGGEYRYVAGPGSEGVVRTYWLNEHEATYTDAAGITRSIPARRSYEVRANASQTLPGRLRARGNVDYFSDVTVQQTYQNNFYDATRRQRLYGGNVSGSWGANSLSATYNINEVFYGETDSTVYGGAPRITFTRAPRRIGETPLYTSVSSQVNRIVRTNKFGGNEVDQGLGRVDVNPVLRVPFSRWPFL